MDGNLSSDLKEASNWCASSFFFIFSQNGRQCARSNDSSRVKCLALCVILYLIFMSEGWKVDKRKCFQKVMWHSTNSISNNCWSTQWDSCIALMMLVKTHKRHDVRQRSESGENMVEKEKEWNERSINLFLCRYCVAFNLSLFLAFLFVCPLCLFWLQRKSIEYVDWRQNGSLAGASINFSESARLDSSVADKISTSWSAIPIFNFIAAGISDTMSTSRYLIALFSLHSFPAMKDQIMK